LAENTLVVFLADHGDYVGEYGLIRKGGDLPEVLARIPMAWRGPGVAAQGKRADACVNLVDILPTLCDTLGVPVPIGSQGKSLVPLLNGKKVPKGEFDVGYSENGFSGLYWNDKDGLDLEAEGASHRMVTFDCLNTWTQCGQVRMVRKGDYKLQMDMEGTGYLYNLAKDPREVRNLWTDPACAAVKMDMLVELNAAVLRAMDPLPAPHRRYRTKQHPQGYWHQDYVSADCGVRDLPPLADLRRKPPPR
jgi:arylsulfatase A-like enzyme